MRSVIIYTYEYEKKYLCVFHSRSNTSRAVTESKYIYDCLLTFSSMQLITYRKLWRMNLYHQTALQGSMALPHATEDTTLGKILGSILNPRIASCHWWELLVIMTCGSEWWEGFFGNLKSQSLWQEVLRKNFLVNCVWVKINENKHKELFICPTPNQLFLLTFYCSWQYPSDTEFPKPPINLLFSPLQHPHT